MKGDQYRRRNVKLEVEKWIDEELAEDIEVLAEHHPALLQQLRDVVCEAE
ncbi:hypothetical protein [Halorubrum miltondacostae]|uniref:CopG family transcriptional regulator n=1 Tax=Halorubrum miltondacostae TaxID=3076378 RepID=A0ABD5M6Q4_9EURY